MPEKSDTEGMPPTEEQGWTGDPPPIPEDNGSDLQLADLMNLEAVESLLEDFCSMTGIGFVILDLEGHIQISGGWHQVCERFHQAQPEKPRHCLLGGMPRSGKTEWETPSIWQCEKGLRHIVIPITVSGRRIGILFLGTFLSEDDPPQEEFFRRQAARFGLNEAAYLAAIDKVPRWSEERLQTIVRFAKKLARILAELSFGNARLAQTLERQAAAEKALVESKARFQAIWDSLSEAAVFTDTERRIRMVNPAFTKTFGYEAGEVMGRTTEFMYENVSDFQEMGEKIFNPTASSDLRSYEKRYRRKDGSLFHAESISDHVRDARGNLLGFFGIHRDITHRKQAEQSQRESEEKFSLVFRTSPYAITITRAEDGRIVDVNDAFSTITGYSRKEVLNESTIALKLWMNQEDRAKVVSSLLAGQSIFNQEFLFRGKDGRIITGLFSALTIQLGSEPHILSSINDITERTALEAQLQQAQKMDSIGRLAGGVAHDFNNMLGVILGHTEMAMERLSPQEYLYGDLAEIQKAAQRSAELTRQLLAFARRQTIRPEVRDLNDTVDNMLTMLRRLIGENIQLVWKPGRDLWPVKIDPAQVNQILANLCVNARDAISGTGTVIIETGKRSFDEKGAHLKGDHFLPGDFVVLAVSDNGTGMDKTTLEQLFEPFFTTKGMGRGTGLGLATVYGIVRQNGGFINVYSEPGLGATFRIYLPRHTGEPSLQACENAGGSALPRGRETVLLVEDEPAILVMVRKMLKRLGYQVLEAATPGDAIATAEAHSGRIDLIVSDVVMPEMNGRDLVLRLTAFHPGLRCLFMSGYTDNVIAHHSVLEDGMNFLQKPFSLKDLAEKARQVLDSPESGC